MGNRRREKRKGKGIAEEWEGDSRREAGKRK